MSEDILVLLNEIKTEMKTNFKILKDDLQILKDDVQILKDDVQILKDDVQNLNTEQHNIKVALFETGEKIDLLTERVDSLSTIQESQHHIIELLSTRSIEQEADLRELKIKSS